MDTDADFAARRRARRTGKCPSVGYRPVGFLASIVRGTLTRDGEPEPVFCDFAAGHAGAHGTDDATWSDGEPEVRRHPLPPSSRRPTAIVVDDIDFTNYARKSLTDTRGEQPLTPALAK